jgi:hypothetical protein
MAEELSARGEADFGGSKNLEFPRFCPLLPNLNFGRLSKIKGLQILQCKFIFGGK